MLQVRMTPFEMASLAPDQFRASFDADPDDFLRELGFEPESCRRQVVKIIATGERKRLSVRDWPARQEALIRVRVQRELMEAKSRGHMARRRVRRLRLLLREIVSEAEGGNLRPKSLRRRFAKALGRRRKDGDLAVSSEREMMARYAGDLSCGSKVAAEVG
jgi:hypothetical protein